VSNGS
jgi:hypothetical protein